MQCQCPTWNLHTFLWNSSDSSDRSDSSDISESSESSDKKIPSLYFWLVTFMKKLPLEYKMVT